VEEGSQVAEEGASEADCSSPSLEVKAGGERLASSHTVACTHGDTGAHKHAHTHKRAPSSVTWPPSAPAAPGSAPCAAG